MSRRPLWLALVALTVIGVLAYAWVSTAGSPKGTGGSGDAGLGPAPLLAGAPAILRPAPAPARRASGVGIDASYPQCGRTLPPRAAFGIVGINRGAPFTTNGCVAEQVAWARQLPARAVYMNTANPNSSDPVAYGRRIAADAVAREHASGAGSTSMWWLDVEVANRWSSDPIANASVLDAVVAALQHLGVRVGIYSTPAQWSEIAGSWSPGLPIWNASGARSWTAAARACDKSFAGSTTGIVQWEQRANHRRLDNNLLCPRWRNRAADLLELTTK